LAQLKVPLLLNYSQCKLLEQDYYAVIEHCTEALKYDKDNVKAYFRRAKAHVGAWNPNDAIRDFEECHRLDNSLKIQIGKELKLLEEQIRLKDLEDKMKYQNLF
jgi:AH receptor-interacting protein